MNLAWIQKHRLSELILLVVFVFYLCSNIATPFFLSSFIDTPIGKVVLVLVVAALCRYGHPLLATLSVLVALELFRRSYRWSFGFSHEFLKSQQMAAMNADSQFGHTLEEEMVQIMAPAVQSGVPLLSPTYNAIDASTVIH